MIEFSIKKVSYKNKKNTKAETTALALDLTEKEIEKILDTVIPGNSKELRESLFAAISESIFSRAEKAIGEEIANGEIWMRIRA